jgi:hypothetical protein
LKMPHEHEELDGGRFRVRNFLRTQLVQYCDVEEKLRES